MSLTKLTIGTRRSKLALWQANHVKDLIESKFSIAVELKKITTSGDKFLDQPLQELGGKGLFLKEIEDQMLSGDIDIAVHSMKDVPYELPKQFEIAAILKREDPSDAFVSVKYDSISQMPKRAVVGTSSLRRIIQLKQKYPFLKYQVLRGNVDTRLRKLESGSFDAIILASAGLKRLGLSDLIKENLSIVSAVGQGAVGIECRKDNDKVLPLIKELEHALSARDVKLERYFSEKVQGTCETPVGCYVRQLDLDPRQFKMHCFYAKPDGSHYFEKQIVGDWQDGQKLVDDVAKSII